MKNFEEPVFEIVEIDENDIVTESYVCPNNYGGSCTGNPYNS